jgi:hypothetical protein
MCKEALMGKTHFSGPLMAGTIKETSGTTLGRNVKNVGTAVLSQSAAITQAGTEAAAATGIVIPAGSTIVSIAVYSSVAWSGVAKTISLGTTTTSTELVVGGDLAAIGTTSLASGANADRNDKWANVGTADVAIYALSANTGDGVGRLVVTYTQPVT